jgi:hypothetical protein
VGGFIDKIKDAVGGRGGGGPDLDAVMTKAQEQGLDPNKVKDLLANHTDEKGNIDWQGASARAQEMGLDAEQIKGMLK